MKLLFVSEARGMSGGASQMLPPARALTERGHHVTLAVNPAGALWTLAREAGVDAIALQIRQDYDVPAAIGLRGVCRSLNPDVMHAHQGKAHAVALIAKHLSVRAPLLVTRRVAFKIGRNPFSRRKFRSRHVAGYVAVCRAIGQTLTDAGVEPGRIWIIPSGVDAARFVEAHRHRATLAPLPPLKVGIVGNYAWFKGHETMIAAAGLILRRRRDVRFTFVGRGSERLLPLVQASGIGDAVELLGERRNVPDLLAGYYVFAMPSLAEGIGGALIEAQMAGVPAVASRLAARGHDRVMSEFRLERVVEKLEQLYQHVAHSGSSR